MITIRLEDTAAGRARVYVEGDGAALAIRMTEPGGPRVDPERFPASVSVAVYLLYRLRELGGSVLYDCSRLRNEPPAG